LEVPTKCLPFTHNQWAANQIYLIKAAASCGEFNPERLNRSQQEVQANGPEIDAPNKLLNNQGEIRCPIGLPCFNLAVSSVYYGAFLMKNTQKSFWTNLSVAALTSASLASVSLFISPVSVASDRKPCPFERTSISEVVAGLPSRSSVAIAQAQTEPAEVKVSQAETQQTEESVATDEVERVRAIYRQICSRSRSSVELPPRQAQPAPARVETPAPPVRALW
jgi:hypothetical protein